jgi:hypothetical protein
MQHAASSVGDGNVHIRVVFLQPGKQSAFMNKVVGFLTGGFSHTELCFPDAGRKVGDHEWFSTSIHSQEDVYVRTNKTFSNPGYTVTSLWVTPIEYGNMRQFIQSSFNGKVGFDESGMWLAVLPFQLRRKSGCKTFCSRYVLECLQAAKLPHLEHYNSAIVSPSKLRVILSKHERCVLGALPSRLQSMQEEGEGVPLLHLW